MNHATQLSRDELVIFFLFQLKSQKPKLTVDPRRIGSTSVRSHLKLGWAEVIGYGNHIEVCKKGFYVQPFFPRAIAVSETVIHCQFLV